MRKDRAEYVTPTTDRFIAHDDAALEQQFLDVAQAQLKKERADSTGRRNTEMLNRFQVLIQSAPPRAVAIRSV